MPSYVLSIVGMRGGDVAIQDRLVEGKPIECELVERKLVEGEHVKGEPVGCWLDQVVR